jgi:uncharacterized protein YkwD
MDGRRRAGQKSLRCFTLVLRTRILNRMLLRRAVLLGAVAAATLFPSRAQGQEASLEAQVFSMINDGRSARALVGHSGLLAAARSHSRDMSREGGLSHNGADERVANAPPDPFETNGAPDDGFAVAAWCENVTYVMAAPESEVARRIYNAWDGSGAHARCMKNPEKNVGAVGIYYDGQTWWATFIAEADATPPGGAPAASADQPSAKPAAVAQPARTTSAAPTQAPSTPAGLLAGNDRAAEGPQVSAQPTAVPAPAISAQPVSGQIAGPDIETVVGPADLQAAQPVTARPPGYGWRELAGVAAVLAVATVLSRRLVKRAPEVERRDHVSLPEVEAMRVDPPSARVEREMVAARR